jgi:hypothetical protein
MGKLAMKATHYNQMKRKVFVVLDKAPKGTAGKALTSMRLRWDIFWAAKAYDKEHYDYLNDNNIDSALKQIMREYKG